tara:strand:- start:452 stop:910 length:459 start_codon:yes stop_codon:yes gene_type:complete
MQLDDTDRRIVRQLLADPGLSTAQLSERAGVTTATCWRRLERLQSAGVIAPAAAVINWRAMGYEVEVSLRFSLDKTEARAFDDFIEAAREVPEVIAIETFLGRVDLRLNVIARDMAHYQTVYRTRILTLPHIADIEALMLIATIKNESALPI